MRNEIEMTEPNVRDAVEIIEWIENGRVVKKTINGVEVPNEFLDPLPTVVYQRLYMTRREVEEIYGKKYLENDQLP